MMIITRSMKSRVDSIERLTATVIHLKGLIRRSNDELKNLVDIYGGCDHSVGLCCCDLYSLINENRIALGEVTKKELEEQGDSL